MSQNGMADKERDFGGEHLHGDMDSDTALQKIRTAGSISISPELFEKLYLQPRSGAGTGGAGGAIRKAVGNPTPLGLIGFLLCLTPLSNDLMNWRGAQTGNGAASIGAYFAFGAILMIISGIEEWIVGNTFPSVVFSSFGAFWFTYATVLDSQFGIGEVYSAGTGLPAAAGTMQPAFYNAFGFVLLWMGVLCFIYMICSLRTNIAFFIIFFTLVMAFCMLTAAFWKLAEGDMDMGTNLLIAGGAFGFLTSIAGWWIFAALLLASVNFPINLPVGDLSNFVRGPKEKSEA